MSFVRWQAHHPGDTAPRHGAHDLDARTDPVGSAADVANAAVAFDLPVRLHIEDDDRLAELTCHAQTLRRISATGSCAIAQSVSAIAIAAWP